MRSISAGSVAVNRQWPPSHTPIHAVQLAAGTALLMAALSPPTVWNALSLDPVLTNPQLALMLFSLTALLNLGTGLAPLQLAAEISGGALLGGSLGLGCIYLTFAAANSGGIVAKVCTCARQKACTLPCSVGCIAAATSPETAQHRRLLHTDKANRLCADGARARGRETAAPASHTTNTISSSSSSRGSNSLNPSLPKVYVTACHAGRRQPDHHGHPALHTDDAALQAAPVCHLLLHGLPFPGY